MSDRSRGRPGRRGAKVGRETPRGTRLEATIDELAPGGDGVAIVDVEGQRRAVFVPGVARGERVALDVDLSTRPARARLLSVVVSSDDRVVPACAALARCGACDWMHLSESAQLREHAELARQALPAAFARERVGITPAPRVTGYRTRARVHVEARGREVTVGMFGRRSHEPVLVETCVVLDELVENARRALPALLEGARGRGEAQLARGAHGPVVDLRFRGDLPREVFARAERAVAAGVLAGIRIWDGDVTAPASIGDPAPSALGGDGAPLRLAPGGFSQASDEGNAALAARVAELASALSPPGGAVLELYAGAGNLTVLLARERSVVAVEADADAAAAARLNLGERGLTAKVVTADAATFAIPKGTKLVVLDPPRTGAKEVARALAAKPVPAVIYVSCDPATLGRDLTTLAEAGYALASVEAFEMFPQTSHVETVAALTWSRA